MVAEGVPRQLRDEPVVLVQIVAVVGEHEVGRDAPFSALEVLLDLAPRTGRTPSSKSCDLDARSRRRERGGTGARLLRAPRAPEDDPASRSTPAAGRERAACRRSRSRCRRSERRSRARSAARGRAPARQAQHSPARFGGAPRSPRPARHHRRCAPALPGAACPSACPSAPRSRRTVREQLPAAMPVERSTGRSHPCGCSRTASRRKTKKPPLIRTLGLRDIGEAGDARGQETRDLCRSSRARRSAAGAARR